MLLSGEIAPDDYRDIKTNYTEKLNRLQVKLDTLAIQPTSIDNLLKEGLGNLFQLDKIYESGSMEVKRQVIGSMYPEKLSFDGDHLRTTRINEAVRINIHDGQGFRAKKRGQNGEFSILSSQVEVAGQNSNLFLADLKYLMAFSP